MAEKKPASAKRGSRRRKPTSQAASQAAAGAGVETTSKETKAFVPADLDRTIIALPLLNQIDEQGEAEVQEVVVDVNLEYPGGRDAARERVCRLIRHLVRTRVGDFKTQGVRSRTKFSQQYVFASLSGTLIRELVRLDRDAEPVPVDGDAAAERDAPQRGALYRIWPDFPVERFTNKSIATVKADAARNAFGALGEGIVWAVIDSGIDRHHPHFAEFKNLELEPPLCHCDFTALEDLDDATSSARACTDEAGHGTHVAGIIAGSLRAGADPNNGARTWILAKVNTRDELGHVKTESIDTITTISGMAPRCKLVSLKVLDRNGKGQVSGLIAALEWIQQVNGYGRRLRIHGVNMSVGYDFEPKWFACGQSPLCVEVDRLVKSGVVVVVAAGNTGYGWNQTAFRGAVAAGMDLTINDPGNADLAITVGSTHRDMPHIYGVSYFSSKGPTGDGRMKPDLVAPGEKIISCEANGRPPEPVSADNQTPAGDGEGRSERSNDVVGCYKEDSGTSMAAPHVSGVVAAFLSSRREFIGRAEEVKRIFTSTATDLRRDPHFQGRGLVDLMRAIQSV